jgi:predicted HTH transcriptional regulator
MTSIADLHEPLWKRFTGDLDEPAEVTLEKLKLISKDDLGAQRMTVAGALMATIRPEVYLPNAFIEAAAYRGDRLDSNYQIDARAIKGPLDQQVREAVAFVRKNMKVAAYKAPGRVEIPQFSIRAVFESIVNAVAHRDYSFQGSKIRLFIFEDRLEIFSPGTIPNSMTLESMALRQSTRNELITTLISRCPVDAENSEIGRQYMMEKRGEGVPIIFSETSRLTPKMPVYRLIDEAELMLTIPAADAGAWGQSPQAGG